MQTTVARDANGEYVLTLKGGQTATLLDVLYGTTATVAEDDYTAEGYEAVSTQTAAVNGQTPDAAVAFTNERNVGVFERNQERGRQRGEVREKTAEPYSASRPR